MADQLYPYIMPQESGNKTDVRWAARHRRERRRPAGAGRDCAQRQRRALHRLDLTEAQHTYELTPRDEVILNVDYAQGGLGNGSCGPGVLEQYQLTPEQTRFQVRLRPLKAGDDPAAVAKERVASGS